MSTRKKRQYVHDLIKVANLDIETSMKRHGNAHDAFGSHSSCPIASSLKRHGYDRVYLGKFPECSLTGCKECFQTLTINDKKYKVPSKMLAWQRRGVYAQLPKPFQFRISELKLTN